MGNVMENGNKKEKVITRMAAYDWLKVMGTLMVVIGHYYAMFPNGSQLPLWSSGTFQALAANGGYAIIFSFAVSGYMFIETLNQMEMIHVNYASTRVFVIYIIVLLLCAKLVSIVSDKIQILR